MADIGVVSYIAATVLFLVLSLLLLTSWRGRLQGALLVLAAVVSTLWATLAAMQLNFGFPSLSAVLALEVLRDGTWAAFFIRLLEPASSGSKSSLMQMRWAAVGIYAFVVAILALHLSSSLAGTILPAQMERVDFSILGHVILAVIGLALVEQLFHNTRPECRWGIKFLCLAVGSLFAYDFFLYSDALLFRRINIDLWNARGFVNAMVVPLIAVSAARNPHWALDVFVSRSMVFHTTALLAAGIYLLVMAAGGYYIRVYGGHWGAVAQVSFLAGATIVLFLILFSGQMRARLKVFLSKHFFNYRYDYREEWLRFTHTLAAEGANGRPRRRAIQAIAEIVHSPGGMLWRAEDGNRFKAVAHWNMSDRVNDQVAATDSLARFLESRQWVIDLNQYRSEPESYEGLVLPEWLQRLPRAWLVVPLMLHDRLFSFIVLAASQAAKRMNWEDNDLLKTAGRQAASHLAEYEASQALVAARQFEAFNRLSAFVVHDLKNLIAQLSLLVSNAAKHKNNPLFIDDVVRTVENSVARMNRLLTQLRSGTTGPSDKASIELGALLREVAAAKAGRKPVPTVECPDAGITVLGDREQLAMAIGHIVQNAQEATPPQGMVRLRLGCAAGQAIIEVEDNGIGMDGSFIQERLFSPFDSTKGRAGMGIGAYESRELIRQMGGDIDVTSRPGEGATFRIVLPLVTDEATGNVERMRVEAAG